MITILNRKELIITMDLNLYNKVKEALATERILFTTKVTNILDSSPFSPHRDRTGTFAMNQNAQYEYKIYVHKDDYEKARNLLWDW